MISTTAMKTNIDILNFLFLLLHASRVNIIDTISSKGASKRFEAFARKRKTVIVHFNVLLNCKQNKFKLSVIEMDRASEGDNKYRKRVITKQRQIIWINNVSPVTVF